MVLAVLPGEVAPRPLQNRWKNPSYFWIDVWSVLGPILVPFWLPFCSMFGSESLLHTNLHQKCRCSRNRLKTIEKSICLTPRRLGNRPQIAPRRLQEVTFSLLNLHLFCWSTVAPFWLPKCLPLGTFFAPQIAPKNNQKLKCSKSRPKTTQFRLKTAQDRPKRPQESPNRAPRSPKSTLRGFKNTPKSLEECLRSQKGTASGLNRTKQHPDGNWIKIHRASYLICHVVCWDYKALNLQASKPPNRLGGCRETQTIPIGIP